MKIKNLNITSKALTLTAVTTFTVSVLLGCTTTTTNNIYAYKESTLADDSTEIYSPDTSSYKVIVFEENKATILDIVAWKKIDNNFIKVQTKDGAFFLSLIENTTFLDESNTTLTAEEVARKMKGDNVEICYLNELAKTK